MAALRRMPMTRDGLSGGFKEDAHDEEWSIKERVVKSFDEE